MGHRIHLLSLVSFLLECPSVSCEEMLEGGWRSDQLSSIFHGNIKKGKKSIFLKKKKK